jgi:hypothetical protein
MNTAIALSMLVVVVSLGVVFISVSARKTTASKKRDSGDSGTTTATTSSSDNCGPADSGGCDGGGD